MFSLLEVFLFFLFLLIYLFYWSYVLLVVGDVVVKLVLSIFTTGCLIELLRGTLRCTTWYYRWFIFIPLSFFFFNYYYYNFFFVHILLIPSFDLFPETTVAFHVLVVLPFNRSVLPNVNILTWSVA